MTYKITFNLINSICFIEPFRPVFDSILNRCVIKQKLGYVPQKLMLAQSEITTDGLPLVQHKDGYFLASTMFYDSAYETIVRFKKKWDAGNDDLVDFGKTKAKISVQSGPYKSYDLPLVTHNVFEKESRIKQVWFWFESEDVARVEFLVTRHLAGIGKKVSQGFGLFDGFKIEPSEPIDWRQKILRPIPFVASDLALGIPYEIRKVAYKIPYWLPENIALCKIPKFEVTECE